MAQPGLPGRLPNIEQAVGGPVAERITGDPLWPTLVARVDTAVAQGADPDRIITDAAGLLTATRATLRPDQYATVLLFHIGTLADPAPVTPGHGVDITVPPTPPTPTCNPPRTCTPSNHHRSQEAIRRRPSRPGTFPICRNHPSIPSICHSTR